MRIKLSGLFGFVNNLETVIYGLEFKLILKRNNNESSIWS